MGSFKGQMFPGGPSILGRGWIGRVLRGWVFGEEVGWGFWGWEFGVFLSWGFVVRVLKFSWKGFTSSW